MQTAYRHLLQYAVNEGMTFTVDEMDCQDDIEMAVEEILAADEAIISFYKQGGRCGSAVVSAYDLEPEETVIDYSGQEWFNNWSDEYDRENAE